MQTEELFKIAKNADITITRQFDEELVAIALKRYNIFSYPITFRYMICLSQLSMARQGQTLQEILAHELGHCFTNSFYPSNCTIEGRQKYEDIADEWAIKCLMPPEEIEKAQAMGIKSVKTLSQYFRVSRDFVRKAFRFYKEKEESKIDRRRVP